MTTASAPAPRKRWWFHLIAIALVLLVAFGILVGADVYLHYKLARYAAVNIWGYRGRIAGRKHAGERRILMIGPSTVFGVGVGADEAIPAQLEGRLTARASQGVSVVNLGFPGEDAFAYRADLEDYLYLKPDAVIFYGDNNHSGGATPIVLRRLSPVFKLTGYYPLIDTALREKAMALEHGGDLAAAYRGNKVVAHRLRHACARGGAGRRRRHGRIAAPRVRSAHGQGRDAAGGGLHLPCRIQPVLRRDAQRRGMHCKCAAASACPRS